MSDIIDAVKRYESARERSRLCGITTVQPVNCIVLNEVVHAGVVTHRCAEPREHAGNCVCGCKFHWKGKS